MATTQISSIAQLVYAEKQPLNFVRVVGDLHAVLGRFRGDELRFEWDLDDIVYFDMSDTRIALGWDEHPGKGFAACLTVSVGQGPQGLQNQGNGHHDMCARLVDRLQGRYPATAVLWHKTEQVVTSTVIDQLVEDLPPLMQLFPFQEPDWVADAMASQSPGRAVALRGADQLGEDADDAQSCNEARQGQSVILPDTAPSSMQWAGAGKRARAKAAARVAAARDAAEAANDRPDLPWTRENELARVREALYRVEEATERPATSSPQMRLAVHAMNATLIVVWAPLGAAVMTYSLLKGEDMKFSARMMVLTGLFATAFQSPMGQQMAAMAGV